MCQSELFNNSFSYYLKIPHGAEPHLPLDIIHHGGTLIGLTLWRQEESQLHERIIRINNPILPPHRFVFEAISSIQVMRLYLEETDITKWTTSELHRSRKGLIKSDLCKRPSNPESRPLTLHNSFMGNFDFPESY